MPGHQGRAALHQRARQIFGGERVYFSFVPLCPVCDGSSIPAEVTIIELPGQAAAATTSNGERIMAKKMRETCDVCGRARTCTVYGDGSKTCTMCDNLKSMCRQVPDVVLATLTTIAPRVLPHGPEVQHDPEDAATIDRLKGVIKVFEGQARDHEAEIAQLQMDLHDAEARLRTAESGQAPANGRSGLVLKVALGVIRGQVSGISADDIELLARG